ncbi:hypothetical protein CLOP_g7866, partial [Closterium sp. NIES-67]
LELSRPCLGLRKGVAEVLEAEKLPKHKANTKIHPLLRCNLDLDPLGREPAKGPKAWAALKGVHAPATAAVAVVLERQMAAL